MFGSDFSDRNKTEVELPKKQYSDFLLFLQFLVPYRSKEISIEDCKVILPLVNEYQVDDLLKKCEFFVLLDSLTTMCFNNELLIQLFQLADRCNLKSVVESIANKLSLKDPKQLAQDLEINLISADLRQKLMERYFDRYQECQSELVQHSLKLDVPLNTGEFENAKGLKVKITADITECTVLLDERKKVLNTSWFLLWNLRAAVSCFLYTNHPKKKSLPQLAFVVSFQKTEQSNWQCETKIKTFSLRCNKPPLASCFETELRGKIFFLIQENNFRYSTSMLQTC